MSENNVENPQAASQVEQLVRPDLSKEELISIVQWLAFDVERLWAAVENSGQNIRRLSEGDKPVFGIPHGPTLRYQELAVRPGAHSIMRDQPSPWLHATS